MFLDVLPKFLGQFGSWQRVRANDLANASSGWTGFMNALFVLPSFDIIVGLIRPRGKSTINYLGERGETRFFYRPEKTSFASARLSWLPISYHRPSIG